MGKSALGFVELPNLCDAINVLDTMLKSAAVDFVTWKKRLGGRLVTIIVKGSVSSVTATVDTVKGRVKASLVIANPHPEIVKFILKGA